MCPHIIPPPFYIIPGLVAAGGELTPALLTAGGPYLVRLHPSACHLELSLPVLQ